MPSIYSYVVRYDSGFAPNPFYGYCTLATCKPTIRGGAKQLDWVVGCGSNDRRVRKGGRLVYAMRVTEVLSFEQYFHDPRFLAKRPFRRGSRKQSCGDNIYHRDVATGEWRQLDSFHSTDDGKPNPRHVERDTGIDRVLVSDDFVYFGGRGPRFPSWLCDSSGRHLCKSGIGLSKFDDPPLVDQLEKWIASLGVRGFQGPPQEWISLRRFR